jgi:hypothetical protein
VRSQTPGNPPLLRRNAFFYGYRFGVITCFKTMLHRRGRREDPIWETVAPSAARMFERALELLG